jgi:multidrug efflux pump subunit AcrA (membrane-fusion protein)
MDIQSIISRALKFVDQRRYAFLVLFLFIVFLIFKVFSGASKQPHHDFPVITMAKVEKQTVPLTIQAPGVVESQQIINIRTRVNGLLKKVHFEDGQMVNKGDLLYTIDDDIL